MELVLSTRGLTLRGAPAYRADATRYTQTRSRLSTEFTERTSVSSVLSRLPVRCVMVCF